MKEEWQGGVKNGGRDKEEGGKKESWQLYLQTLIWTVDLLGQLVESLSVYTGSPECVSGCCSAVSPERFIRFVGRRRREGRATPVAG